MQREMRWVDHVTINIYWLGLNVATGTITPVLLPYLVVLYAPADLKNTYLANVRWIGLAVAMLVQPIAGLLSDRSTARWGRRRPFIAVGTLLNLVFLLAIGASTRFVGSPADAFFQRAFGATTAYAILLAGIVLMQVSSNVAQGPLQALIPDLVPENQRGRASGVKAVMELAPAFLIIFLGPLVDAGRIWLTLAVLMCAFIVTLAITLATVHERPLRQQPAIRLREPVLRLLALTALFVAATRLAVWLVTSASKQLTLWEAGPALQVAVLGAWGLAAMAGSIVVGVYLGARVGIGRAASRQRSFIWWVVNRLLFLAAVGSIQSFAQYYLADVMHISNAATMTTLLLGAVAVFLVITAIAGGALADRIGHRRLVALSGLVSAAGTLALLLSRSIPTLLASGCVIGAGTGTFMATNWALGTRLAPPEQAGRYLGISNLAGAGAGIVGAGIGGPLADFLNALRPGLGYLVIFALYGALFLLSVLALTQVRPPTVQPSA